MVGIAYRKGIIIEKTKRTLFDYFDILAKAFRQIISRNFQIGIDYLVKSQSEGKNSCLFIEILGEK